MTNEMTDVNAMVKDQATADRPHVKTIPMALLSGAQRDQLIDYLAKQPFADVATGIEFLKNAPTISVKVAIEAQSRAGGADEQVQAPESESQEGARIEHVPMALITLAQRNALLDYLGKRPYCDVANGIEFLRNAAVIDVELTVNPPAQEGPNPTA